MVNILLVIHDKNSVDLIKALCSYKGCRVLDADSPQKILKYLQEETINIVFVDKKSQYLPVIELFFPVCDYNHETTVILISDTHDKPENIELYNNNIFYRLGTPLDADEVDSLIDAAITTVKANIPPLPQVPAVSEIATAEKSHTKKRAHIMKPLSKTFNSISRNIINSDRKIVYSIRDYRFEKLENIYGKAVKPFKKLDIAIKHMIQRIL